LSQEKKYFILVNNIQEGPFTIKELKSKFIHPEAKLWNSSFDSWKSISDIEELKEVMNKLPPKLPKNRLEKSEEHSQKRTYLWVILVLYIAMNVFFFYSLWNPIGVIISTGLSVFIWHNYGQIILRPENTKIIKWINCIIIAQLIFGVVAFYLVNISFEAELRTSFQNMETTLRDSGTNFTSIFSVVLVGIVVPIIFIIIGSIGIMRQNKLHPLNQYVLGFEILLIMSYHVGYFMFLPAFVYIEDIGFFERLLHGLIFMIPYLTLLNRTFQK
jgi:hypothetical protein